MTAPRCVGFIDGTFRPHTRPGRGQRQCYSGYKKLHGIKFQSVVAANGLIVDFFGCVVGRRGDSYLLSASGLHYMFLHVLRVGVLLLPDDGDSVSYIDLCFG